MQEHNIAIKKEDCDKFDKSEDDYFKTDSIDEADEAMKSLEENPEQIEEQSTLESIENYIAY